MLNQEEILIKLMQLLDINLKDIKLKQSSEKQRFITQEESNEKYQKHLELIFEALNLDKKNEALFVIFQELLFLYISIYQRLLSYVTTNNIKKINWILLKRLVVPFLAYRFANLDVDYYKRIDKNMLGGIFWYLPNLDDPKNIKMPIPYLMHWWLDLYGKGVERLCDEIDGISRQELDPAIDENTYVKEAQNILKPWMYKNITPSRQSLKQYLRKKLTYTGIFKPTKTVEVHKVYLEALEFVQQTKKLSLEEVTKELPHRTLLKEIYSSGNIDEEGKKEFIKYVKDRWSIPGRRSLITKFLIARAVQNLYKRLRDYFEFNDSPDIEENKVLQLVYQYMILYNMEMARSQNKLNINDLSYPLYYEMIEPFRTPINEVITTIVGDITIELTNPKYKEDILEDNHLLKMNIFIGQNDNRLDNIGNDVKDHYDYFHKEFDDINKKIKDYERLDIKSYLKSIEKEENFTLLENLYRLTHVKDYLKAEKICFQMDKMAKNKNQEIKAINSLLIIYCDVSSLNNRSMHNEAKALFEEWLLLLEGNYDYQEYEKGLLLTKANFYLKAKEFNKSLRSYDKLFNFYIDNQKKEDWSGFSVYLAAYSAYTAKDKVKLKKYNKYLKKRKLPEFKTQKSLPFSIYFYK